MHGNALMSSNEEKIGKYDRTPEVGAPANTEGWALLEAAKRIATAITQGPDDDKGTREIRRKALRLNWRLWTIFQAELTLDSSPVPEEIRLNILTLCNFVDKHTVACLADPIADKLAVLIDINRNIAAGLMQVPEGAENQDAPEENAPEEAAPDASALPGQRIETEA